jgi:hypothetical protein
MTNLRIQIRMQEEEDLEVAQKIASEHPDLQVEAAAVAPVGEIQNLMAPVTAVLIFAGAAAIAKFVMDWWDARRGGLVINMRPDGKDQIYRNRDVPYGYILIFPSDGGQVKIETRDMPKNATQQLLEEVISGVFKNVGDLAKAAKEAMPSASVEENPAPEIN